MGLYAELKLGTPRATPAAEDVGRVLWTARDNKCRHQTLRLRIGIVPQAPHSVGL
jgi:hypothetical protein